MKNLPVSMLPLPKDLKQKDRPSAKRPKMTAADEDEEESDDESSQIQEDTEAGVESTPTGNGSGRSKGSGPVSVTLTDLDVLDCPICFEPLSSPVYQCKNGHIACASCCTTTLKNKCATCRLSIQIIRNRAIEKVLESVMVTCQHELYGCKEVFFYSDKLAHDKACKYIPCSCPWCDFIGSSKRLYDHFAVKHKDCSKQFRFGDKISVLMDSTANRLILREEAEGVLFVLNRKIETLWSYFNVVCVAPPTSEKRWYELVARNVDDSIRLQSSVEMVPNWTTAQFPAKMSVVVPSTSRMLCLDLVIWKDPARPARSLVRSGVMKIDEGEAWGVVEAIRWAQHLGLTRVVIELDSKRVVDDVKSKINGESVLSDYIDMSRRLLVLQTHYSVMSINSSANILAHTIARTNRDYNSPHC